MCAGAYVQYIRIFFKILYLRLFSFLTWPFGLSAFAFSAAR